MRNFMEPEKDQMEPNEDDLWFELYSEYLGCDKAPQCIASAIQDLKAEVDRAMRRICELQKGTGHSPAWKI